jgi:O-antigen/teichoic acid export membrane protein
MINKFIIYAVAGILNRAVPFVLLPVITRYLAPEEFGMWSIFQACMTFAIPLIGMNSPINITRNYYRLDKDQIAKLIGNLLIFISATFTLLIVVVSLVFAFGLNFLGLPKLWIYAIPFISFSNMVNQFNLTVLRNRDRAKMYGLYEIAFTLFNILTALGLILLAGFGWSALAWGRLSAGLIFSAISLLHLVYSGYFTLNFDVRRIKEILLISLPLVPHALGGIIIRLSDRLFIDVMLDKTQVGLYSIGYTFGSLVFLVTESFNKVWSPWIHRQFADINIAQKKNIVRYTYYYNCGIILLAMVMTAISYVLIDHVIDPSYRSAKVYVIWVSLGLAIQGMYFMIFPYLVHVGKTNILGLLTGVTALVNLIGNYVLIGINGTVGAAQSTLLSYAFLFLTVWVYVIRAYPMPWFNSGIIKNLQRQLSIVFQK